jgi:hypothetical protein
LPAIGAQFRERVLNILISEKFFATSFGPVSAESGKFYCVVTTRGCNSSKAEVLGYRRPNGTIPFVSNL